MPDLGRSGLDPTVGVAVAVEPDAAVATVVVVAAAELPATVVVVTAAPEAAAVVVVAAAPTTTFETVARLEYPPGPTACTVTLTDWPFVRPVTVQVVAGAVTVQVCPPAVPM